MRQRLTHPLLRGRTCPVTRPVRWVREEAVAAQRAAPVRTLVARLIGLHTAERAWRLGAVGEEKVGHQLARLAKKDPRWRVVHAIPAGNRGSDIDHLVIGPGGVFTVNAKHQPGASVWVGGDTSMVNGQRQPYIRNSRHEAARASRLLSAACGSPVAAHAVVVPVRAKNVTVRTKPDGVDVVPLSKLARWFRRRPATLDATTIQTVYDSGRWSTTWTSSPR